MLRELIRPVAVALVLCSASIAQSYPPVDTSTSTPDEPAQPKLNIAELEKRPKLSDGTKIQLIGLMTAEFARSRKTFPVGYKDIFLTDDGQIKPEDARLYQLSQAYGAAAKVGDRVQITKFDIHEKSIYLEINGGPKKKSKWYQHITIGGMGGSTGAQDPNQAMPTGAAITLEFKKYVPEMTGPEMKQLLGAIFDFSMKSSTDVYLDSVPPKVKAAIKNHEVLVGMNRDMVVMAKDRPPQKVREKDEQGKDVEEWIYGKPPEDVTFVQWKGDEVALVKIMKQDGEKVIKTEKEVDVSQGVVSLAAATARDGNPVPPAGSAQDQPQGKRPTLTRPDDKVDPAMTPAGNRTQQLPQQRSEPQWGDPNAPSPGNPTPNQRPPGATGQPPI